MQLSEKEVEDFIFEDLSVNHGLGMASRGLTVLHTFFLKKEQFHRCKWLRQVDLGPYGKLDIVGFFRKDGTIHIQLLELKSVPIQCADFDQIFRYKKGIEHYFGDRFNLRFHLYLIGTGVTDGHYVHNNVNNLLVCEYSYSLNGILFETSAGDWYKTQGDTFNYKKSLRNSVIYHEYKNSAVKIDLDQKQIDQ